MSESHNTAPWTDCYFLRPIGLRSCVVRLIPTGAVIQIILQENLDITRASLVCATKPAPAKVRLAEDLDQGACTLDIAWPPASPQAMPPPARYVRKVRTAPRKTKRPRHH